MTKRLVLATNKIEDFDINLLTTLFKFDKSFAFERAKKWSWYQFQEPF